MWPLLQPAAPGTTEADVIRWVGVAVSVVGAVIAAPDGLSLILSEATKEIRSALRWLRVRLAKWLPFLRKPVTVLAGSGTASFGANATVSATVTRAWDADATVEAKFNVVRREIADLRQELEEDKSQLAAWRSDLAQRIDAVDSKLRDATSALIRRLDKEAHEAARIDARGLPLIGLGIVLAGVPDGLADHWDGDVGWALIGVAALLTAAAVRSARRSRTLRH